MTSINCFDFEELRQRLAVSGDTLVTVIEHGIIEPIGADPRHWQFDVSALLVLRRVLSLKQDLDLDWQGAALAAELIEENRRLRQENEDLQRRLLRFGDGP